MKKIILLISAVLLTVAIYATNVVIKNTDVTTPIRYTECQCRTIHQRHL